MPGTTEFPLWWPSDANNIPYTKCYRAMRPDMDDFVWKLDRSIHSLPEDSRRMRELALRAVEHGSTERSPFLHASWRKDQAHRWHLLAQQRGESQAHQILVQIDIWGWYKYCLSSNDELLHKECIIDLSSDKAQHKFFDKIENPIDMTSHGGALQQAKVSSEVLLKWRGAVPMHFFTVLDPTSGLALGPLLGLMHTCQHRSRQVHNLLESVELEVQNNLKRGKLCPQDIMMQKNLAANKTSFRQAMLDNMPSKPNRPPPLISEPVPSKPEPIPPKPIELITRPPPQRPEEPPRPSEAWKRPRLDGSYRMQCESASAHWDDFNAFIMNGRSGSEAPHFLLPLLLLPFLSLILLLLIFLLPLPLGGGGHAGDAR